MLMAKLFQELKRHGKNNFELVFLVMNPGYNDLNYNVILNNAKILDIPITVFKTEIFDTVCRYYRVALLFVCKNEERISLQQGKGTWL